jgi:hypothetical protein
MATVRFLADSVQPMIDELTSLKSSISESYAHLGDPTGKQLKQSQQVRDLDEQSNMYDRLFEEEEAKRQAFGVKTRAETLQEFVLLFFFIGYGVFTISMALFAMSTQGSSAAIKIVLGMLFSLLLISGILIRYA